MRLLVTRPREDAERTAERLRALGHQVETEPLLTIQHRPGALDPARDLAGVQALLATSLNGLRAYLAAGGRRDLPVLAVGPASAAAARAAGFASVRSAEGDAERLAELAIAVLDPADGALLHPAGTVSAGDLAGRLGAAGFELRRRVLYEAEPATALSERTRERLRARAFDGVLFYSPRTAATFVSLVRRAGLADGCAGSTAYCLSSAVAAALEPLPWRRLRIATAPQEEALLQTIAADATHEIGSREMAENDEPSRNDPAAPNANGTRDAQRAEDAQEAAAERLIARFGGLRPMAGKLGIAVSTVQGWKSRGHIPPARTPEIRKAAAEHGVELDEAELAAATAELPGAPEGAEAAAEPPVEAEVVDGPRPWGSAASAAPERQEQAEEPEAAAPHASAAAATPPPSRGGGSRAGAWLGGLLLGALLVVGGGAAAVLTQPYWQPYVDAALPGLEERIEGGVAPQLEPLRERVAALESAPAPEADTAALEQQLDGLQDRVASLEERLEQAPAGGASEAELEALRERLSALEARPAAGGGADPEALETLRQRVEELGDSLAAAGADPQALEGFRDQVSRLQARFDDLGGTIEQLRQSTARVEVVQDELAQARGRLEEIADRVESLADDAEQDRSTLEQQVAANAEAIGRAGEARNQGALLALALGQLREALRFAEPYEQELGGVEAVAEGAAGGAELAGLLEPLQAHAASGVANLTALRRQFSELAPEIVGATYGSGEQGWLREVMDRVPELVTVRPVGQATGDSVGARVARAERALAAGDLPAAIEEVAGLEGEAAEVAAPWLERARARLAVDAAMADLTRRAIVQLTGSRAAEAAEQPGEDRPAQPEASAAPSNGAGG